MTLSIYKYLLLTDLYRITGKYQLSALIRNIIFCREYKYIFWMRTCQYSKRNNFLKFLIYPVARLILYRLSTRYGVFINPSTKIGCGFNINHIGDIVINSKCTIGDNCTISHGVTLGQKNRGKFKGYPVLGDNVYIGPGVKIIGSVKVGNNVAIGANSVVTKDIPDNAVVVGVPGKVISYNGVTGYVVNINYDDVLEKILHRYNNPSINHDRNSYKS